MSATIVLDNRYNALERKESMNEERRKLLGSIVRMIRTMDTDTLRALYRLLVHMQN